MNITKTFY